MIADSGEITLDDQHRYWWNVDGSRTLLELWGVTRTLHEANLVDDEYFTDIAAERGTLVHALASLYATGALDIDAVDERLKGFLDAVQDFYATTYPSMIGQRALIERMVYNKPRRAAGLLDFALMDARELIDFKTGQPTPWHGVQLAAYAWLLFGAEWHTVKRYGVYLRANGTWRKIPYESSTDLPPYLAALDLMNWRALHGRSGRLYGKSANARVA